MNTQQEKKEPISVTREGRVEFGRLLLEYRKALGMSLDNAVAFIEHRAGKGMSKSALGDIESGATKQMKLDTLLLLCQAGWGGMSLREMVDVLTGRRLSDCEESCPHSLCNK